MTPNYVTICIPFVVVHSRRVHLYFAVPTPDIAIVPYGPIEDGVVGSPKEIHCTVSTVSGVELSSVVISWMGPGGDTIRNNSRVIIGPTTSVGNDYISTLEFFHLMEGDEGIYICNMTILETKQSDHVEMGTLFGEIVIFIRIFVVQCILMQ